MSSIEWIAFDTRFCVGLERDLIKLIGENAWALFPFRLATAVS